MSRHLRFWQDARSGQTLVLAAAGAVVLTAMVALAADLGLMRNSQERMQTAADSAAIAAMKGLQFGDAVAPARKDAAMNGFTDGSNNVSVAVNNPPSSGHYSGNNNYVQVVISQPQPTYFLRALGINSMNVSAAAAATLGNGPACVYSLDPNASSSLGTLDLSGNVQINANCGFIVDSSSSSAISASGGAALTATSIGVVGNYSLSGGASLTPTPKTGVIPADDPLAYVPSPTVGTCDHTNYKLNGGRSETIDPGTYCNGIGVTGNSNLTLNPGTYVISGGGVSISGGSSISGTGVTIFNSTGNGYNYSQISISGGGTINLTAPTTGSLAGILIFEDRAIPKGSSGAALSGGATANYTGAIYLPHGSLTFTGNSSSNAPYTIVVADNLVFSGGANLNSDYSSLPGGSPIKAAVLAE